MAKRNNSLIIGFLISISIFLIVDVIFDYKSSGISSSHIILELVIAGLGILGAFWGGLSLIKLFQINGQLREENNTTNSKLTEITEKYSKFANGLSAMMDKKFSEWKLTSSEKEIGILLVKGNSLKEIGLIRETSEATVRQQTVKIYEKSGVAGRAEFSALFLQDFWKF